MVGRRYKKFALLHRTLLDQKFGRSSHIRCKLVLRKAAGLCRSIPLGAYLKQNRFGIQKIIRERSKIRLIVDQFPVSVSLYRALIGRHGKRELGVPVHGIAQLCRLGFYFGRIHIAAVSRFIAPFGSLGDHVLSAGNRKSGRCR